MHNYIFAIEAIDIQILRGGFSGHSTCQYKAGLGLNYSTASSWSSSFHVVHFIYFILFFCLNSLIIFLSQPIRSHVAKIIWSYNFVKNNKSKAKHCKHFTNFQLKEYCSQNTYFLNVVFLIDCKPQEPSWKM